MRLFQLLNLTKVDRRVQSTGIYYSSREAPGGREKLHKGSQHQFHSPNVSQKAQAETKTYSGVSVLIIEHENTQIVAPVANLQQPL